VTLSAQALLERFEVFGRFYDRTLDGQRRALRSHLEIVERGARGAAPWRCAADLVAVMMNPGASRPLAAVGDDGWAAAVPDRTQYQLMRLALVAQRAGWPLRHIRVLNLSDLRTPKSAELFQVLRSAADGRHSIFAASRRSELAVALGPRSPVLRAWGMAAALVPLAQQAVAATASREVLGLTDDGIRYRHPLPQRADLQARWLEDMTAQVERLAAQPD
jgi:hypothetical protein